MSDLIDPDDVIVAIMGMTGAGKSTFISRCTKDQALLQGHGLVSCTSRISIYTTKIMGRSVHLLDTPGFDDSERSDIETLQELAYWLAAAYERKVQLSGIIYLHRISDTRLQGSALRALNAFKAMCGEAALGGVVLATTMWDTIPPEELEKAENRQLELQNRICHDIQDRGGRVAALSAASIDGMKILQHMVERDNRLTLRFQQELMVEKLLIHETEAGRLLLKTTSCSFESLQSATDASHRVMVSLVGAGQMKDVDNARDAVIEMAQDSRLLDDDIKTSQVTLAELRKKWEMSITQDDVTLEEALHANEESLRRAGASFLPNEDNAVSVSHNGRGILSQPRSEQDRPSRQTRVTFASDISSAPQRDLLSNSSMAVDSAELMRERQAIMLTMDTRLSRRRTPYSHISPRVGIIGTGLALGQLVATLACTVM